MFLGHNLSLLTPFAVPKVFLLSKSTGYNLLPFLTPQITLWAVVKHPWGGIPPPYRIFEVKLSVPYGRVGSFFMLFLGEKTAEIRHFFNLCFFNGLFTGGEYGEIIALFPIVVVL